MTTEKKDMELGRVTRKGSPTIQQSVLKKSAGTGYIFNVHMHPVMEQVEGIVNNMQGIMNNE